MRAPNANDLGHDAANFGWGVELALALATFGGEMAHQILISISQNVVAIGTVLREVQRRVFKRGDQVGEPIHHLFASAELGGVIEVRHVGQLVGCSQRAHDALVDLVANVGAALERHHVGKAGTSRDGDGREGLPGVLVADVFDEQQHQHVILVLAGIHAAAQFVTRCPEGRIELRFLDSHGWSLISLTSDCDPLRWCLP